MGVFGTGIFSDDNAADLREEYRTMLGDGVSGPEATDRLLRNWNPDGDPDLAPVFWLAIAVTQWKCGRLEQRVKDRAIQVIDDGTAMRPWKNSGALEKKRAVVLEKTKQLLKSPQPASRKIAKKFRAACEWEPGELISYRLLSGDFVVFQVVQHHQDAGGVSPVCEFFDWQGKVLPPLSSFESMPMRAQKPFVRKGASVPLPVVRPRFRLMIGQANQREFPKDRVMRLHASATIQHPPVARNVPNPTLVSLWRSLDETLETSYGFR